MIRIQMFKLLSAKILLLPPECEIIFIAPHLDIALPTLR